MTTRASREISQGLRLYTKLLAVAYMIGALLHLADIFDLRLKFSTLDGVAKVWIIYLLVADLIASVGLWKFRAWGIGMFIFIAASQLIVYTVFRSYFGEQTFLITFHLLTIAIFIFLSRGLKTRLS